VAIGYMGFDILRRNEINPVPPGPTPARQFIKTGTGLHPDNTGGGSRETCYQLMSRPCYPACSLAAEQLKAPLAHICARHASTHDCPLIADWKHQCGP